MAIQTIACTSANAQQTGKFNKTYLFTKFTTADGLASPEILSLCVDHKGYLWLGSAAGLSRYDGYSFTHFSYTIDNQFIGTVHSIKEGKDGSMWIGSSKGLFHLGQNNIFKINQYSQQPVGIYDLIADEDGSLWIASDVGPLHIPKTILTSKNKRVDLNQFVIPPWKNQPENNSVSACKMIRKSADGTIYFAQQYQVFQFDGIRVKLLNSTTVQNDKIEELIPLNQSTVFFNSSVTGLHKINAGNITNYQFRNLYQPARKPDSEGIWYTGSLGVVCFHPAEEFISESINFEQAGAQWLTVVLKDQQILWLASHSGLTKIKPSFFQSYNASEYPQLQESFSMIDLGSDKKLFGGNHGELFQFQNGQIGQYLPRNQLVEHAEIKALHKDQFNRLWIATGYEGFGVVDKGKSTWFRKDNAILHDNSFASFLVGKNGSLFAIGDKGMTVISENTKDLTSFKKFFVQPVTTQYAKFYDGVIAPGGTVWIGGEEGLRYQSNDSLLPYQLIDKNLDIRAMEIGKDGTVWMATLGEGILACKFNSSEKLELIKQYSEKDGLNSTQYLSLLIDQNQTIWAGSIKGLSLIQKNSTRSDRVINYTESDGFIKPGYYNMYLYQDLRGRIWAGSSLGLVSFDPTDVVYPIGNPRIYFSSVSLIGPEQNVINDSLYSRSLPNEFSYQSNSIHFDYSAIDPMNQEGMRYLYRLEGLDTNWVDAHSERSVSYYSLEPGSYKFSVRAINAKGVGTENPAEFKFIIHPPFWKTWWFVLLVILSVVAALFFILRNRILKFNARARLQLQLTELEMKALRAQMNPHFIFNAMSSIQEFTVKNDIDNAHLYISKFSTLLRKVLHSSQQNFISLEEELEIMLLYLEIEKQRIGSDFQFIVSIDESLESDAIKIPGMMLQPFVENALKHGLALKEGLKLLEIIVSLKNDKWLLISISDNGIGRVRAAELKKEQEKLLPYHSRGIELVKERISLLYPEQDINQMLDFQDLLNPDGSAAGTTVSLCIPLAVYDL